MPDKDNMPWGIAKTGWAKYATHMSMVGGLFLGPIGENSNFTKMFKLLVPEEEALLGLHVKNKPTSVEEVAKSANIPVEKAAAMLKHMSQKGLLFEHATKDGKFFYHVPPFIPGFYEFVMTDPDTIQNPQVAQLFRNALDRELGPLLRFADVQGGGLMKVTPIMNEINAEQKILQYEDILTFINNAERYSIADCACRTAGRLTNVGCDHPYKDTCMQFDETADYYVRTGRGHYLTKEEAIAKLKEVEEAGLVHCAFQVEGQDYTTFICNCCGCSCAGLRQINRLDANPMSHSNFRAQINEDNCVACGECVKICPINAITLGTNLLSKTDAQQQPYWTTATDHRMKKEDLHENFINERHMVAKDGTAPCIVACPAHVAVQGYIQKAAEGKFMEALELIKKDNPLPAICGKICSHPCEAACTRNTLDESLSIDAIKMFIAEKENVAGQRFIPAIKDNYDEKVAIIGAGPAGLTAAYYLRVEGFQVTVFDKNEKPGGMLEYGIPAFRLEKEVIASEIEVFKEMGIEFKCGVEVGKDVTIQQLREEGYKAFYLAIGAQQGSSLGMAGEEFPNVMNGVDYLFLANAGKETGTKGDVIVVGGGNVAIDVARTAIRKGAKSVKLYCLESKEEMPAASDEQIEAKDEGITIHNGWGPMVIENDGKEATGITFKKCTSVIDENGKFNPSYDESVTEKVEAQTIILSIGQRIDWGNLLDGLKVETGRGNAAVVKELSFQTAEEDIFAGGDVVTGPRFAIDAIAAGKEGAHSIFRYLTNRHLTNGRNYEYKSVKLDRVQMNLNRIDLTPRQYAPEVDHAKAIQTWNDLREGLTEDQIAAESGRCLHCGRSVVDMNKCIGCGVCIHRCEFDAIKLIRVDDTASATDMKHWYGRLVKNVAKRGANIAKTSVMERLGKDSPDA